MKNWFPFHKTCYFNIEARLTKEEAIKLMEQLKDLTVLGISAESDDGDLEVEDCTVSQINEILLRN